jgi:hypothetical protein
VQVYDAATGKWFEQETSGTEDMPSARADFCAVSAVATDRSSAQIYIFGGSEADAKDAGVDVHVVSDLNNQVNTVG